MRYCAACGVPVEFHTRDKKRDGRACPIVRVDDGSDEEPYPRYRVDHKEVRTRRAAHEELRRL